MFFTTIEDEATLSGLRIQNIFTGVANNIKSIFDKTARISFNGGFEAQFQSDVIAIQNYINQLNAGRSAEEAFAATMRSASIEAQNFANSLNATTYSEEQAAQALSDFTARQNASQISMMAQNRSLSNVRLLMNEYNSGMQTCGLTTQQFRQSVGEFSCFCKSSYNRFKNCDYCSKCRYWYGHWFNCFAHFFWCSVGH